MLVLLCCLVCSRKVQTYSWIMFVAIQTGLRLFTSTISWLFFCVVFCSYPQTSISHCWMFVKPKQRASKNQIRTHYYVPLFVVSNFQLCLNHWPIIINEFIYLRTLDYLLLFIFSPCSTPILIWFDSWNVSVMTVNAAIESSSSLFLSLSFDWLIHSICIYRLRTNEMFAIIFQHNLIVRVRSLFVCILLVSEKSYLRSSSFDACLSLLLSYSQCPTICQHCRIYIYNIK